jgi:hypothetical protein
MLPLVDGVVDHSAAEFGVVGPRAAIEVVRPDRCPHVVDDADLRMDVDRCP